MGHRPGAPLVREFVPHWPSKDFDAKCAICGKRPRARVVRCKPCKRFVCDDPRCRVIVHARDIVNSRIECLSCRTETEAPRGA